MHPAGDSTGAVVPCFTNDDLHRVKPKAIIIYQVALRPKRSAIHMTRSITEEPMSPIAHRAMPSNLPAVA